MSYIYILYNMFYRYAFWYLFRGVIIKLAQPLYSDSLNQNATKHVRYHVCKRNTVVLDKETVTFYDHCQASETLLK